MALSRSKHNQSHAALDWVVFFLSDVETGVGPFMAGYFTAVRHWNPEQIGVIIAAQKIASVITQASTGWLIDRTARKHWLMAATAVAIACGSAWVVWAPGVVSQVANQVMVGAATSFATLLVASLSLGLAGHRALPRRIGRNGALSHAGNMLTAAIAGYAGFRIDQRWIFFTSAALGLACSAAALSIRGRDIDNRVARSAPEGSTVHEQAVRMPELLRDRTVLMFATVVLLFHCANSAMLPLAGEEISQEGRAYSSLYLTLCIVVPQIVMIPVSVISGRGSDRFGRKPMFLLAFAALVARGVLFALNRAPNYIVGVEVLDGIGTGITGVITVLIIADLAKGTGRFNALGGLMQSGLGMGAFLGTLLAGMAAKRLGFPPVFSGLAAVSLLGLLLLWFALPETRGLREQDVKQ